MPCSPLNSLKDASPCISKADAQGVLFCLHLLGVAALIAISVVPFFDPSFSNEALGGCFISLSFLMLLNQHLRTVSYGQNLSLVKKFEIVAFIGVTTIGALTIAHTLGPPAAFWSVFGISVLKLTLPRLLSSTLYKPKSSRRETTAL